MRKSTVRLKNLSAMLGCMEENALSDYARNAVLRGACVFLGLIVGCASLALPWFSESKLMIAPFALINLAGGVALILISFNIKDVYLEADGLRVRSWRQSYRVPARALMAVSFHPTPWWGRGPDQMRIRLNDVSIDGGEFTFASTRQDFEEFKRLYKDSSINFSIE